MIKNYFKHKGGFTLVELAIVLVVIGIILGMVFKGKELIDSAKIKATAAQVNKIIGAMYIFYERYGFYPGDGCTVHNPSSVSSCTGIKDGYIRCDSYPDTNCDEGRAFWHLLINVTNILSAKDIQTVFGQPWIIYAPCLSNPNAVICQRSGIGSFLDLPGGLQLDVRMVCQLDKMMDDGMHNSGRVVLDPSPNEIPYNSNTDCFSLNGQVNANIRILP